MEVYIEYVILDNLIINFLVLFCTIKTLGVKNGVLRLFIASAFGTFMVCLFPLVNIPDWLYFISILCVGIIMVLMSYNFESFKQFLIFFILFVVYTCLFGGACYACIQLLDGNPENLGEGNYNTIVPVSLIIFICFAYSFIILRLTKYIYRKKDMLPFMQQISLKIGEKTINLTAYTDSGNRLYDKKTGAPVIILSAYALEKYYSKDQMISLVFGEKNDSLFKNIHYLHYGTIEGVSKKMVVFVADKLVLQSGNITKEFNDISVGVTFKKFNDAINYDVLLHPSLVSV